MTVRGSRPVIVRTVSVVECGRTRPELAMNRDDPVGDPFAHSGLEHRALRGRVRHIHIGNRPAEDGGPPRGDVVEGQRLGAG